MIQISTILLMGIITLQWLDSTPIYAKTSDSIQKKRAGKKIEAKSQTKKKGSNHRKKTKKDSLYYHERSLRLSFFMETYNNTFGITNFDNDKQLDFNYPLIPDYGIEGSYKGYTVSGIYSKGPRTDLVDGIPFKRQHQFFAISTTFFSPTAVEFNWVKNKGFMSDLLKSEKKEAVTNIREDIAMESFEIKVSHFYTQNPYRLESIFLKGFNQRKSAGGMYSLAQLKHFNINADRPLIGNEYKEDFDKWNTVTQASAMSLFGGIGYGYTFSAYRLVFPLSIELATGLSQFELTHEETIQTSTRFLGDLHLGIRMGAHWAGNSYFTGLKIDIGGPSYTVDRYALVSRINSMTMFLGKVF